MEDITKCSSNNCPIRASCYRVKANNSTNQSWINFEYTCNEYNGYPNYIASEKKQNNNIIKTINKT